MKTLEDAVAAGIITADQAEKLGAFLGATPTSAPVASPRPAAGPRFDLAHLLWYAGALLIISAMGLFSTLAFGAIGAPALLVTAVLYAAAFLWAGDRLWRGRGLETPGGLLVAVAVSMAPLAVYALQDMAGWWAGLDKPGAYRDFYIWIRGGFLPMEVATIAAALLALRRYPFPFLLFLVAVALWFMSMDLADWLRGGDPLWQWRRNVSLAFGLVLIPVAWAVDLKAKGRDYGFWLHLVAVVTFWGGLTFQESSNEIGKLLYFLVNLSLLGFAVFLSRRAYAVFGAIGAMVYIGHLTGKFFKDWITFPFVLTVIGLGVIWLGILWQRNSARIEARLVAMLPAALVRLRPQP